MHLNLESLSCRVERCHELFTVIENLKIKGTYYQEVALNTFQEKWSDKYKFIIPSYSICN
jgi:hypothetical protein